MKKITKAELFDTLIGDQLAKLKVAYDKAYKGDTTLWDEFMEEYEGNISLSEFLTSIKRVRDEYKIHQLESSNIKSFTALVATMLLLLELSDVTTAE